MARPAEHMRVAAIQLNSARELEPNLSKVASYVSEAAVIGAQLVVLPENFAFMGGDESEKRRFAEDRCVSATLAFLSELALHHKTAIVGGTLLLRGKDGRLQNSSAVFGSDGRLLGIYDKIHLFDMDYGGEVYRESALIKPGSKPLSVDIEGWRIGLSTCYDLRFPELYRLHAQYGCQILINVAAFTAVTGAAHWEPLLRARAIENQCYVIAAAQSGVHDDGRETWGHSMVIDPWGAIMVQLAEGEGVITADLSLQELDRVRRSMPVLKHRRL